MPSDEAYLVLEISESHLWNPVYMGDRIPPEKRATVLYDSRANAEIEALRLQCTHPRSRFAVFKATHMTAVVMAPSHVTLGGQTLRSRTEAVLAEVGDDLPF